LVCSLENLQEAGSRGKTAILARPDGRLDDALQDLSMGGGGERDNGRDRSDINIYILGFVPQIYEVEHHIAYIFYNNDTRQYCISDFFTYKYNDTVFTRTTVGLNSGL
jgi:hypothetical protein